LRPSFESIWMNLAVTLAKRSTCKRAHVGSVVVSEDNQRVLAIGYNGNYKGGPNHCDSDEPGLCGCLHSEENSLIKLNYNDSSRKKIYTTTSPCVQCAKRIINASIDEVIYLNEYRKTEGLELLRSSGVYVRKISQGDIQIEEDKAE